MSTIKALKAALAAVPVGQPCTAAAVGALFTSGHAAAKAAAAAAASTPRQRRQLQEACLEQQLPGACIPVLVWLAAGLRSGLPPAAVKEAHGMGCLLLMVVTQSLPATKQLSPGFIPRPQSDHVDQGRASLILQLLGTIEVVCQQLAEVVAALVATAFPANPASTTSSSSQGSTSSSQASSSQASSSSSSSTAKALLKLQLALAMTLVHVCPFLLDVIDGVGQDSGVPAFTGSGLYQALMEGTVLLLAADPAAYPQTPEVQQELWDSVRAAAQVGILLAVHHAVWVVDYGLDAEGDPSPGCQPWAQPLFKLQVLLLAKLQWDVRQCPEYVSSKAVDHPWPAKALTRALTKLRSPCVAGELLRQRAPLLLQHKRSCRRPLQTLGGPRWVVAEEELCCVPPSDQGFILNAMSDAWLCCDEDRPPPGDARCAFVQHCARLAELGLLMEAAELYCLVVPTTRPGGPVIDAVWRPLATGVLDGYHGSYAGVPAAFATTCGEALISIAEYLTADVLLVMSSGGSSASNNSSSSSSSSGGRSSKAGAKDEGPASTSRSSTKRPTAGGKNPNVNLEMRLAWAEDALTALGLLVTQGQVSGNVLREQTGYSTGLITNRTAPRLRLLMETTLRTPLSLTGFTQAFFYLLPRKLPALHAAASSLAGSRALLSAATTAAKRLQVTNFALAALVEARGVVAPAAAGVRAAVPGPMGHALAEQLVKDPAKFVEAAYTLGEQLAAFAVELAGRAAVLLDPFVGSAAAYLASRLPPGQDSKLHGMEAFLTVLLPMASGKTCVSPYLHMLADRPDQVGGIQEQLNIALHLQKAAPEAKRAAKLAEKMGAAAGTQQALRQLGSLSLDDGIDGTSTCGVQQVVDEQASSMAVAAASSSSSSLGGYPSTGELPGLLQKMCDDGYLQREEVLAAGDPAQWAAAAADPPTSADLRVASTAVLMVCKVAGAVAQLPQLLQQVQVAAAQQPWRLALFRPASPLNEPQLQDDCNTLASWALLLDAVLALAMPSKQAQQLREEAAAVHSDSDEQGPRPVTSDVASRVLSLLGYVAALGAPGCSYPGCLNLEGRTEAELPAQACSKCKGVRYCCREHQVAHWKVGHKEECKLAQASAKHMCDVAASRADQGMPSN